MVGQSEINTRNQGVNISPAPQEVRDQQENMEKATRELRMQQNLPLAIIGGAAAALIGAALWALVTVITEYQIGYMALGVGLLVGYAVRITGKGIDPVFGVVGAVFALLGCVLGNFFAICYFFSAQESIPFMQLLMSVNPGIFADVLISSADIIDLLFYGIALYEGYHFAFRHVTEEEVWMSET